MRSFIFLLLFLCPTISFAREHLTIRDTILALFSAYESFLKHESQDKKKILIGILPNNLDIAENGKLIYYTYDSARRRYISNGLNSGDNFEFFSEDQNNFFFGNNSENNLPPLQKLDNIYSNIDKKINSDISNNFENRVFPGSNSSNHNIRNDYLIFFINPSVCLQNISYIDELDPISFEACIEKCKDLISADLYGVDTSIESLIFSKNYSNNNSTQYTVPDYLKGLLSVALEQVKETLNQADKIVTKDVVLSFQNPDATNTLWINESDNNIYVSPFIVRAAFLYCAIHSPLFSHFYDIYKYDKNHMPVKFGEDKLDYLLRTTYTRYFSREFINQFLQTFYFVLGHELAHIYLSKPTINLKNEILCDCYSLRSSKKINSTNLGVFSLILEKSITNGYSEKWWGCENISELNSRFLLLDSLVKKNQKLPCE